MKPILVKTLKKQPLSAKLHQFLTFTPLEGDDHALPVRIQPHMLKAVLNMASRSQVTTRTRRGGCRASAVSLGSETCVALGR